MSYWKCFLYLSAVAVIYDSVFVSGYSVLQAATRHHHHTRWHKHHMKHNKVNIRLYYECLCPFSVDFYVETLNKTVALLGSYLDLEIYPFGNAEMTEKDGETIIICQHGPDECYGNKLHACAIDILNDITLAVTYNSCMMSPQSGDGSTDKDAADCGQKLGIDANPIIECAKDEVKNCSNITV